MSMYMAILAYLLGNSWPTMMILASLVSGIWSRLIEEDGARLWVFICHDCMKFMRGINSLHMLFFCLNVCDCMYYRNGWTS